MDTPLVTTRAAWTSHGRQCAALGIALGILFMVVFHHFARSPAIAADTRMEAACVFPKLNGEALIVVMLESKLNCWVMK